MITMPFFLRALLDLFLPRECLACGCRLGLRERHLCLSCAADVPADVTAHLRDAGKIAVLMGSLCAGILGSVLITFVHKIQSRKAA